MHELIYLALRAHVYASGGLVEYEYVAVVKQPLGQYHLLLVASGQAAHLALYARGLCAYLFNVFVGHALDLPVVHKGHLGKLIQRGEDGIVRHGQPETQAVTFAVLREISYACGNRIPRGVYPYLFAVYAYRAAVARVRAAYKPRCFGAPCAHEPGEAEYLALFQIEGYALYILGDQLLRLEYYRRAFGYV